MTRSGWIWLLSAVGVVGAGALALWSGEASAAEPSPTPSGDGDDLDFGLPPLPTAADVQGDLTRNWGDTPVDLRALFMKIEEASRIAGSARVFATIAFRESAFVTRAHNGDAPKEQPERDASRRAYESNKGHNPPLRYGEQAADFGSGGLFGLLAPYFLWTGVPEVGAKAPLLNAPPEIMFEPRAAAFGAAVYMQRILKNYRVDDIYDVKAGWASPSLLGKGRGGPTYKAARARFLDDSRKLGIDLEDRGTIPAKLDVKAWPGVLAVFEALCGKTAAKEVA
ncbi:MAG: hypothetical protein R3B09_33055 [Nannocystaceae bacterium]